MHAVAVRSWSKKKEPITVLDLLTTVVLSSGGRWEKRLYISKKVATRDRDLRVP